MIIGYYAVVIPFPTKRLKTPNPNHMNQHQVLFQRIHKKLSHAFQERRKIPRLVESF
jgi:hypothetical protein